LIESLFSSERNFSIISPCHITLSFGALARGLKSERSESAHVLASQRPKGVPTAFC
jgi:hypothetical protein